MSAKFDDQKEYTVGDSENVMLVDNDPKRTSLLIQNRGSSTLYFKFDSNASANDGFEIRPGGSYSPQEAPTNKIMAISAEGNIKIVVAQGQNASY